MNKPSKQCLQCGEIFYKKQTTSSKDWEKQVKFCSRECYWESRRKVYSCLFCGEQFNRRSYGANEPKFCSRACLSAHQSKVRTFPRQPCKVCERPVKKVSAKYCSISCRNKGYRSDEVYNFVGENFRKDAYPVDYAAWKEIAKKIRKRDKVCQHCSATPEENGRALDVHHVEPYRVSQDNSPSNLVALCRSCHKKADSKLT